MDQRGHRQYQTNISKDQARGTMTRGHVGGYKSNLEVVGPSVMRTRLDLSRGKGTFDWWRTRRYVPASNQHDSNPAIAIPLLRWLSTNHNLIDLAEKAFAASESKDTSNKMK